MKEKVIRSARELGLDVQVQRLDASTRTVGDAAKAAAGDPHSLFCVSPRELTDCTGSTVLAVGD